MQGSQPSSALSPLAYVLMSLAGIAGSLLTLLVNKALGRPRELAERSEITARTGKTEAEARQIDSEIVIKAYQRLDDLETIIHAMNIEKQKIIAENVKLDWELGLLKSRERIHEETIRQAHAELELLRTATRPSAS